jgi:hypothetical protein
MNVVLNYIALNLLIIELFERINQDILFLFFTLIFESNAEIGVLGFWGAIRN